VAPGTMGKRNVHTDLLAAAGGFDISMTLSVVAAYLLFVLVM